MLPLIMKLYTSSTTPLKHVLSMFLLSTFLLIIVGFIFIYSASASYALDKFGKAHYYIYKHSIGFLMGIIGLAFFRSIPFKLIRTLTPLMFIGSLGLTALTLIHPIGITIHGSSRWLMIKGFMFQPSELLKMSLILYLAHLISKKQYWINSLIYGYIPFLCITGISALILLKQPDFGQAVTLCAMALCLWFIAQVNTQYIAITAGSLIPLGALLIYFKPYRFKRILVFLDPWKDPQGSGYQIIQSLSAIAAGGIKGIGLTQSNTYDLQLPMQHTDFIFSVIAQETGFIGSCSVILLYILFLYYGFKIAAQLKDPFCTYIVIGFVLLTTIQALINISVAISLLPTKGLGLPFISFGRSSLICDLWTLGIITNAVAYDSSLQQHG